MKTVTSKENRMGQKLLSQLSYGILLSLVLTIGSATSFAAGGSEGSGPGSGGGGKGVCISESKGQQSYELLDLWEAENKWDLKINRSDLPVEIQVENAIHNLTYLSYNDVSFEGDMRLSSSIFLNAAHNRSKPSMFRFRHQRNVLTEDSYENVLPDKCKTPVVQIVNWDDFENTVYVNEDLYDQLPKTDQAALILHEILYHYLRSSQPSGENDSLRVRRAIGLAFSGYTFKSFDQQISGPVQRCTSGRGRGSKDFFDILVFANTGEHQDFPIKAQILTYHGRNSLGFDIANLPLEAEGPNPPSFEQVFSTDFSGETSFRAGLGMIQSKKVDANSYVQIARYGESGERSRYLVVWDHTPGTTTPSPVKLNCFSYKIFK